MIAKPTKTTIPIAILMVIIITFLGWMFDSVNSDGDHAIDPSSNNTTETRPNRLGAQQQRPSNLRPANINTSKRLAELYSKYPELALEDRDPEKDLASLYLQLFPEKANPSLSKSLKGFQEMLDGNQPWDADEAHKFLDQEQDRLNALIGKSDPSYYFQENLHSGVSCLLLYRAFDLLTTSFAIQAKLGEPLDAITTYTAVHNLSLSTQRENALINTNAIIAQRQLNKYTIQLTHNNKDLATALLDQKLNPAFNYSASLKEEFYSVLSLVYRFSEATDNDQPVIELDKKGMFIPLSEVENTLANHYIHMIHAIDQYEESSPKNGGFSELLQHLKPSSTQHLSDEDQTIINALTGNYGTYYETGKQINFTTETQRTAIKIALAQQKGETFSGNLPLHYKTGKPVVWDKDNNLLRTGIEPEEHQDNSTINIPSLLSNDE